MRYSVVIPTYQRRALVLEAVRRLAVQTRPCEVIVVVDGSTDGSAQALRELSLPLQLTVLEQPNQGPGPARNRGAEEARGERLLFLDDDMEADRHLLAEHDRCGAEVVFGHIPLHPGSPASFLSRDIEAWTEERCRRLAAGGGLELDDLLSGQVSLSRRVFHELGGFDPQFRGYGDEDLDLFYRAHRAGHQLAFAPTALSWQRYLVTPRQQLARYRQAGRADARLTRKHPELQLRRRREWSFLRPLRPCLRALVLGWLERGGENPFTTRAFYRLRDLEYWDGRRR